MQAGVAKFKSCNNFFDCATCAYDQAMMKKAEQGKQLSWQDAMRLRPALERICRHSLTGRMGSRACAYDYHCETCDFDQLFEDVWTSKTGAVPLDVENIRGFDMPLDYHFHNGHAWARVEDGGSIRIGLDDFALRIFGKADALDLPLMGKQLDPGKAGWGIRRKDNLADVLSPIGGVIMEVNAAAREQPDIANRSPYADGWLFTVRTPDVKKSVKELMNGTSAIDWIGGEIGRLEGIIEEVAGPLAADGGLLADDIFGKLPGLGWSRLARAFLKTG
jgi:glycine cleavage system H lipoate-binding protein